MVLIDFWKRLSRGGQIGLLAGLIGIAGLAVVLTMLVGATKYALLFDNLGREDAAVILNALRDRKVEYQINEAGDGILVSQDQVSELRLDLSAADLPLSGGLGFELFDNADYGMTDFAQKINFQRALQGELARTITTLSEVQSARVHLVLPEDSLFSSERKQPKASVTLKLAQGAALDKQQIAGIQGLVASSIEGLDKQSVMILNEQGLAITAAADSDDAFLSTRLERKREVEQYLTQKVERILNRVFGPDSALVNIDVTLDFNKVQKTVESMMSADEDKGLLIKSKTSRVINNSKNKNTKDNPAVDTGVINEVAEFDYEVGKEISRIEETAGRVLFMSVSVLVPDSVTEPMVEDIASLVSTAVGLQPVRGDRIEVRALPLAFNETLLPLTTARAQIQQTAVEPVPASVAPLSGSSFSLRLTEMQWYAVAGVGSFLLLLFVAIGMRQKKESQSSEQERQEALAQIRNWLADDGLPQAAQGEAG